MLYDFARGFRDLENFRELLLDDTTYSYSGFFYMLGYKAGEDSVRQLHLTISQQGMVPFIKCFGAFTMIIERGGSRTFFTDNSQMHALYLSPFGIADRFLSLLRHFDFSAFDMTAVCELLTYGTIHEHKTPVQGITLSKSSCYYVSGPDRSLQVFEKEIGDIDGDTVISDPNLFFEQLAYALSDLRISLSLTGGYDSRLIFACLQKFKDTHPFISGNNRQDPDIVTSEKVARSVGSNWRLIETPRVSFTEELLNELFEAYDGMRPFISAGAYRIMDFTKRISAEGTQCYITGDSGTLHKDWYWTSDLPFYRRKKTNVRRFFRQRVEVIKNKPPFSDEMNNIYNALAPRIMRSMESMKQPLNTQSYDFFAVHVLYGSDIKTDYSRSTFDFCGYAPLRELELVRYSYHLPRMKRFFYKSMREITTKASKDIARIPTVYGTTASSEGLLLGRDVFFQALDYFRKAMRLAGRVLFKRAFCVTDVCGWTPELEVRKLPIAESALDFAIETGWLRKGTTLEALPYSLLASAIQLKLLSRLLK